MIEKIKKFLNYPATLKFYVIYMRIGTPTIEVLIAIWVYLFKYRKFKLMQSLVAGFKDHRITFNLTATEYEKLLIRICHAFILAKKDQQKVDDQYQIGGLYYKGITTRFKPLTMALNELDLEKLKKILGNFQRSELVRGMGTSGDEYHQAKKNLFFKYAYINRWCKYYKKLTDLTSAKTLISYSLIGNPAGILIDGSVIHPESIRFHYTSQEICSLLQNIISPVICEIGSGVGGQAYKIINDLQRQSTYILFDLPEILVFASYFLLMNFPKKKILLYGEGNFNEGTIYDYDIILMPNYKLPCLQNDSIDLFFNDCSFSEMESNTVREYFKQIERTCRKYFMHINHTAKFSWNNDGKITHNLPATEISPDPDRFKKIYQHYRIWRGRPEKLFYAFMKAEHFTFLYERVK